MNKETIIERLRVRRALRDEAFWIVVLPLLASVHPDAQAWLLERWELLIPVLGYLAHNGYLRGKAVAGMAHAATYSAGPDELLVDELMVLGDARMDGGHHGE